MGKDMTADDAQLLRRYAENGSDDAFTELVQRHINLVWAAAWRITGDADLARDVSQSVFTDLARKAGRLPGETVLSGWLYRASCLTAAKAVRSNVRRSNREREAMEIQNHFANHSDSDEVERLLPVLDRALGKLNAADRDLVVLRFFAKKSLAEVGRHLGVSDDAAQKRLSRALSKLRGHLQHQGLAATGVAVASALGAASAQAAPIGMAAAVAASSLTAATVSIGAPLAISSLKTQFILMKTQLIAMGVASLAVATPLIVQQQTIAGLRREQLALETASRSLPELQQENDRLLREKQMADELERLRREQQELQDLRATAARLKQGGAANKLARLQTLEAVQKQLQDAKGNTARVLSIYQAKQLHEDTVDAMKNLGIAARIYSTTHGDELPDSFDQMKDEVPEKLPGDLSVDGFEFVPGHPTSEENSDALLIREKTPRQLPSGEWVRVYSAVDGSVQEAKSNNGNFEEWEQSHMKYRQPPVQQSKAK